MYDLRRASALIIPVRICCVLHSNMLQDPGAGSGTYLGFTRITLA
jgi:hypothetical protein